jgi:hypothetical protein
LRKFEQRYWISSAMLDDLRAADEITRRFERRYWLSSADFYELYNHGLLDDGEHTEDFALWAGFYEINLICAPCWTKKSTTPVNPRLKALINRLP